MSHLQISFNSIGFELYDGSQFVSLYRATEELPRTEAPKPCFAPIYTPSGGLITEYRPPDHPWHTGLYFGWVHVNDANLWGGGWYIPDKKKYEDVPGTHGVQRHDRFSTPEISEHETAVVEELTWLDASDEPLALEKRHFRFQRLDPVPGYLWFITSQISPAGEKLTLGASRAARYSGFWVRTGPPFSDAQHRSSEGLEGHEHIMGQNARWVSAAGAAGGMVVMMDHPDNPRYPTTWFTRKNILSAGLLMNGDLEIDQGDILTLKYGFAILDHAASPEDTATIYDTFLERA